MNLYILDTETVIAFNKMICKEGGNPFHCFDPGKIDSALHATFYPGSYPFAHGGIAKIAGAMAFYICQAHAFKDGNKRTATVSAITFLNANGLDVGYPQTKDRDDLSDLIIGVASGSVEIAEVKAWFESHKCNF